MIREHVADGVTLRLDLEPQVLELDAPEIALYREPELAPCPSADGSFVSASVLAQKAKQFDDALYASVELAAQAGGKAAFLRAWADAALAAQVHGEAASVLYAACELGGAARDLPPAVAAEVARTITAFRAEPRRCTPLGFYSQSSALSAIFCQDRMLMGELTDPAAADALATLLSADAGLGAAYESMLSLARELTNPPAADVFDLRARQAKKRRILVPSRSHEADLILRLYGSRPIPPAFDLLEELVRQVAAGTLSLAPRADSGWYDHQTWALEPLVAPERTRESDRLKLTKLYRGHLKDLFKSLLALTRETHIKQLEPPACGSAYNPGPPRLCVQPQLDAEPLATHYARRAESYRFVRNMLRRARLHHMEQGLDGMEALFHGAHVRVCRQLGMQPDASVLPDRDRDGDEAYFRGWTQTLDRDPDLRQDNRMMVPVFYDLARQQMKVWALLGWSDRPVRVGFGTPPRILETPREAPRVSRLEALRERFRGAKREPQAIVEFVAAHHQVASPVTVELYVDRLLNREEFRALCDRHKTQSAITRALGA
jgi:hypothetical protein